ncbi:MAG: type II toxin-antitoxin system VapC family toxin, partial [Mesorhizobium sp.]
LALAIRENAIAVTADRGWGDLDIGCKIELIR